MSRTRWIVAGAAGLVVAAVAAVAVWFFILRDTAPPPVALESAVSALDTSGEPPAETEVTTVTTVASEPTPTTAPAAAGLDGTWQVDTSLDSFVGYRVQEELASIGGTTAVGRTRVVEGSLAIAGTEIAEVAVTADLTQLESDESRRDRALRTRGLETDAFPTATFDLTEPIVLNAIPVGGETIATTATGELTIHGVTREVEASLEALLDGEVIAVVGSIPVTITDYDIDPPVGFSVLSIDEDATVEFQLFFAR